MHILLTDVLTCPRCGPEFGLIVLADRLEDRRVLDGSLGCANCREEYPVQAAVADLRHPPGHEVAAEPAEWTPETAFRLAALLGVGDRPGTVLLAGFPAAMASEVARLLPAAQVVAEHPAAAEEDAPPAGVNWVRLGERLPFRSRSLRAAAARGGRAAGLLDEVIRALAPGANLVLDPAPPGAAQALESRGLRVLLEQEGVVVASPPPPR